MGTLLLGSLLIGSIALSPSSAAAHRAQWESWRTERLESLRHEDGWLTLIGLFWLEEGDNSFGSDPSSRIVLPAGRAPAHLGSIGLSKGSLSVRVVSGSAVTHEGRPVTQMSLKTDTDNDGPTVLRHGSLSFQVIARGKRLGLRVKDSEAQTRKDFRGIEMFPYDERYRVQARFEPMSPPRAIAVPNVLGDVESMKSPGSLVFQWHRKTCRLDPVAGSGPTDLFVVFGDSTNGRETYGGGRFLDAQASEDGKTVLDFNKAYNPPCVFTPYATCPLPPRQNRLPFRVEAGEKSSEH